MTDTAFRLPCGCIIAYNAAQTNEENLVLDLGWCKKHRQLTVLPEPKTWESRETDEPVGSRDPAGHSH